MRQTFQWWALKIAIICVVAFVLQNVIPTFTEDLVLVSSQVLQRPWTMLSSIFLHGSFSHLFYNMFALVLFGSILEKVVGTKNFLLIFFISGLVASVGALIFYEAALGASGAIYGIMGSLAIVRPRLRVFVGMIPMPMILAVVVWAVGDFIGLFAPGQIAYAAHLFGLAFGIVYTLAFLRDHMEKIVKRRIKNIPNKEMRKWEDRWMK